MVIFSLFWLCNFVLFGILQAEHGPDSQVVLVAASDEVDIAAIQHEVERQCRDLPRDIIATKALSHSHIVVAKDMAEVKLFLFRYSSISDPTNEHI